MDHDEPKTRKEQKGGKYKAVFNAKTVRMKEAMLQRAADAAKAAPGSAAPKKKKH